MAILFDLDGTFLDSAPDFQVAANLLRSDYQLPPTSLAAINHYISQGSLALVEKLLKNEQGNLPEKSTLLQEQFLHYYATILGTKSKIFEGIELLLDKLDTSHIQWGIVTNKKKRFTEPLLKKLNYFDRAACVVSGDSTNYQKPHPAPLYYACQLMKTEPEHCIFIGDAECDIQAGRSAGMTTMIALYGYIKDTEISMKWAADYTVKTPHEIWEKIQTWMQ